MIAGNIGGFEVGLDGGERGFNFMGGVCDEKFLGIIGVFDGFDGLFGEEVGEDGDDDFDAEAGDDEGEEEGGEAIFAVGKDAFFHELADVGAVFGEFNGGFERVGAASVAGVFGDEINASEGGDEDGRGGGEVDEDEVVAEFFEHSFILA